MAVQFINLFILNEDAQYSNVLKYNFIPSTNTVNRDGCNYVYQKTHTEKNCDQGDLAACLSTLQSL